MTTSRRDFLKAMGLVSAGALLPRFVFGQDGWTKRPNIVLIMTDDQGWGQTGYYGHPALKTPNLDAMAANGLRFDRFYAGGPVCSPTRATVLTGRTHDRCGVESHGYALRLQEKTLPTALRTAGYATGHFGKWHLNGLRGPGAPILADDTHSPGAFGFDEWLSVTNFFDMNPILGRKGAVEDFKGDSSSIIVKESLAFMEKAVQNHKPFLAVVWDGSPHSPWKASDEDRKAFADLDERSQQHYGELAAFDRSIGTLRAGLRKLGVERNTLVWYCSDNGGLPRMTPDTVGGLRGYKGSLWEGGIRVPGVIEWPGVIEPRITMQPACTMDIFPTVTGLLALDDSVHLAPLDGMDLGSQLLRETGPRRKPIPFRFKGGGALVDDERKLVVPNIAKGDVELYNLADDPKEAHDLAAAEPDVAARMTTEFRTWTNSVGDSVRGKDYPEGRLLPGDPESRFWKDDPRYQPYLEEWKKRPEYSGSLRG